MKLDEIKPIAERLGIKPGRLKKSDLIRLIQEKEGNNVCFDTGASASCGQDTCLWRPDCD